MSQPVVVHVVGRGKVLAAAQPPKPSKPKKPVPPKKRQALPDRRTAAAVRSLALTNPAQTEALAYLNTDGARPLRAAALAMREVDPDQRRRVFVRQIAKQQRQAARRSAAIERVHQYGAPGAMTESPHVTLKGRR